MSTHYQQLERFTQDDKWEKLQADLDRGYPSKEELFATIRQVIEKAKVFLDEENRRKDK